MSNAVLESIQQVLGNLERNFNISTQTYVDRDDMRTVILSEEAFAINSKSNRQTVYSTGQLIFGRYMIIQI